MAARADTAAGMLAAAERLGRMAQADRQDALDDLHNLPCPDVTEVRPALHELVDRLCDAAAGRLTPWSAAEIELRCCGATAALTWLRGKARVPRDRAVIKKLNQRMKA